MSEIRELSQRTAALELELEGPKEDLKLTIKQGCAALGLREDAFKLAHKLKNKLDPVQRDAWLATFDQVRKALDLDAQGKLELGGAEQSRGRGRKKTDDNAAPLN